jgi:serine/threonine-protein kinase
MSTDERWRRVEALYHAALQRPPGERSPFLRDACAGDEVMRRDVESLLAQPASDVGFLQTLVLAVAARSVETSPTGATLTVGQTLGRTRLSACSGRAAWARSTAHLTGSWAAK